MANVKLH